VAVSNFKLNLPTDIPWKRICVTRDMLDRVVCDERLPGKWRSSVAVFKYRPPDEFQEFPDYDITYLKVTATIAGYQPLDQEIQGEINWGGVNVESLSGLTDLLNTYNPCHGAILQVVVGPAEGTDLPIDRYPFFMDFEPKKRELYEMATDTQEKQSRSIESLNITKSAGSTQSMEVLDIDQGGGGFGAQGSYAGTGGGFTYQAPHGQWGTKRLNADESLASRSSDVAQEKRETYSFSTQLSQMYHLLDSYHLGTNRAVFFVQPRPHTLEEPSGFVRGPRPVEGIQEFFLIVAQPKDEDDYCVSVRLDTSHLTTTPIMDYDRKTDVSDLANASAPIPTRNDTLGAREKWGEACFIGCWDMYYQCYLTHDEDDVVYQAPDGYVIESYTNVVNSSSYGSSSVTVSPDRKTLSIHAEANGKICFEDTFGCVDCPDEWQKRSGSARRQVQVNLVSTEPTRKVGEEQALMLTTRGLCCCARVPGTDLWSGRDLVVDVAKIPGRYQVAFEPRRSAGAAIQVGTPPDESAPPAEIALEVEGSYRALAVRAEHECGECRDKDKMEAASTESSPGLTIRQVNEMSDYMKTEALRILNDPSIKPARITYTEFFARRLHLELLQSKHGRRLVSDTLPKDVPGKVVSALEKHFGRKRGELRRADLLSLRNVDLAKIASIPEEQAQQIRLAALGVSFEKKRGDDSTRQQKPRGGGGKSSTRRASE
jgi:hypothetical protein